MTQRETLLFPDFGALPMEAGKIWVIATPVAPGDFVVEEDTVLIVECEKASLEVPAPKSGRVSAVHVKVGDVVTRRSPMLDLDPLPLSRQNFRSDNGAALGNGVFLVHGHNEALREMSARFMEKLGLEVVILNEQVNRGATIIEKLERHSAVRFAVVLMTADDLGSKKDVAFDKLQARARQNVVLELGYFMGRIGRQNVCVLYENGVELPSDYYGVVFIEIDEKGAWRYALAKELRHGGLQVDLNRL